MAFSTGPGFDDAQTIAPPIINLDVDNFNPNNQSRMTSTDSSENSKNQKAVPLYTFFIFMY